MQTVSLSTLLARAAVVAIVLAAPERALAQDSRTPGHVRAWGENSSGQLGDGTLNSSAAPVDVVGLDNVVAVAAGHFHSLALKRDGTVWAWGRNDEGQLGDGTKSTRSVPVKVVNLTNVTEISAGDGFSVALKANGTVWTWGLGNSGRLGHGADTDSAVPVQVVGLTNVRVISAGGGHTLAATWTGTLWSWGYNNSGELGNGTTTHSNVPVQVNLANVVEVAAGNSHSLARVNRDVYSWGHNASGQLGDDTNTSRSVPAKIYGPGGNYIGIAAGDALSLAMTIPSPVNYTIAAWGFNGNGALGDGTNISSNRPVVVANLGAISAMHGFQPSFAGGLHGLAVISDGTLRAWGHNVAGQLGDGSTVNSNLPVAVSGLNDGVGVVGVAAVGTHSFEYGHSLAIVASRVSAAPQTLAFGSVGYGTVSAPKTFTITNDGPYAVDIVSLYQSGLSGWVVTAPTLPLTLLPDEHADGSVVFDATAAIGDWSLNLDFSHTGFGRNAAVAATAFSDRRTDIALSKTSSPAAAVPGDTLTYALTVTNNGPSVAATVVVSDSLPASLTFASCSATGGGVCDGVGNNWTVSFAGMSPGVAATIVLTATVNAGVADGSAIVNTASAVGCGQAIFYCIDQNPANNSVTWSTTARNRADLMVSQSVAKGPNRQLTYVVSVKNLGPYSAGQIVLNDPLPSTVRMIGVSQGTWACSAPPPGAVGTLSCGLAGLATGATASVTFVVKTTAPGSVDVTNTVSASALSFDPNTANNSATLVTRVSGK